MFSIAIWDIKEEKLILIRDFAGIKPLFYGIHGDGLVFASQFNQIFHHPVFSDKKLRPEIMKEFFGLGYMHAPNTVFENIFQLEPGQFIVWDFKLKKVIQNKKYFEWIINPNYLFSECFERVVKNQLHADVPVASFLSSGYDSTLVTAYAKRNKKDIKAFTFGVDDPKLDETDHAKVYANILGVAHLVEHSSSDDLVDIVEEHFKNMPEPFGDYSSIPTYLITQKAKNYATVMLSGDGGDELFWGYPRFRKSLNQSKWFRYPLWLRKLVIPIFRKFNKNLSRALDIFPDFSDWILQKQVHFNKLEELMPRYVYSPELKKTYAFYELNTKPNVLNFLKKNEFYAHMQRTLKKVDLTSMANSLEVRVPFLDKKMIEFSNSIISEFTIKHDRPKLILKDALYEHIPIEKVEKQKRGFSVPINEWLSTELKENFLNSVLYTPFYGQEHIDNTVLHTLVKDFFSKKSRVDPWGLWHLYAWQKWAIHNGLVEDI
jgi:asparagine synthase (glutamine-hydrolysing)